MRPKKLILTPAITYCNSSTAGFYSGSDLLDPPVRVNAAQAFRLPSQVGERLSHPCGRVTDLSGQPLPMGTVL